MPGLPSRENLAAFAASTTAIGPAAAFGWCRGIDAHQVSILHWYALGLSEWVLPVESLPETLRVDGGDGRQCDVDSLEAPALQRFLVDVGASRIASAPVPLAEPATRLWMGALQAQPLSDAQMTQFVTSCAEGEQLLQTSPDDEIAALRRLELAAGVLPTLLEVLDVREVFDHLSRAARPALPHDIMVAALFSEDLTTYSVFAVSGAGTQFTPNQPNSYAPSVIRVYRFAIVDDLQAHPLERQSPAARLGARSSIRASIRYRDRVVGNIAFASFEPRAYTTADAPIVRRLADQVAVGLSHYQLAEEGRRTTALRERAANLDLLDELLTALVESDEIADVFGRVSEIAGKVLKHDAAVLAVWLPDGQHARMYASHGFPADQTDTVEIPEDVRDNPNWEHSIFDDLSTRGEKRYVSLSAAGFRSLLRVPIRHEGQSTAALVFLDRQRSAFDASHIAIARRIADRLAVALARDRELAASRRADEASDRAARLEARVRALTDELNARGGFRRVIGESAAWRTVLTQATQVAATETTVLLLGESGTGKEVVARLLHRGSQRNRGPFVALNCAALPEQLLEAELFGYERGAFTGATQSKPGQLEQASGGTLFLDEVGEMSPGAQAKFLRVLQEREFQRLGGTRVLRTDARIVAATNRDLPRDIAHGRFREDLYYRLNVFAIHLPPLRDRRDDIPLLSDEFLADIGRTLGRPPSGMSRDARQLLLDYHWPGNVRELRNILERAAILCDGGLIAAEHLALAVAPPPIRPSPVAPTHLPTSPTERASDLSAMEKTMIEQALQEAKFNKSRAAKALGLTRHQLYIRMRRHGLE